eukprot:augustus_masked-scaffold_6-processed-gene-18.56-mRNA-1 protein AED:1.00 eAED:1.00 QI:0/-1/0/0/-1/1/1/0/428
MEKVVTKKHIAIYLKRLRDNEKSNSKKRSLLESNVKKLELSGLDCTSVDLQALLELKSLKRLDLSNNKLNEINVETKISEECFIEITWLSLLNNCFTNLKEKFFIEKFKFLRVLNLAKNQLDSFPSEICSGLINLEALILNNNFISGTLELKEVSNLSTLVISHNKVKSFGPNFFKCLPMLKKLSAADNEINHFPSIVNSPLLSEIRLAKNKIKEVPNQIEHSNLRILDLGQNLLSKLKRTYSLKNIETLENLNISGNPFEKKYSNENKTKSYTKKILKRIPNLIILNGKKISGERSKFKPENGENDQQKERKEGSCPDKAKLDEVKEPGASTSNLKKKSGESFDKEELDKAHQDDDDESIDNFENLAKTEDSKNTASNTNATDDIIKLKSGVVRIREVNLGKTSQAGVSPSVLTSKRRKTFHNVQAW